MASPTQIDNLTRRIAEQDKEIEDYKKENKRYVETLQKIADGKGKYATLAKEAL